MRHRTLALQAGPVVEDRQVTRREQETLFRQWVAEHGALFARIARGFASGGEQQDLVQEMLLATWNALSVYRADASPRTFMYRIAQNTAYTWLRRRYRRPAHVSLDETDLAIEPGPDRAARETALYGAIRRLPELDRSLVLLHLDELSYREIAAVTGLSESNIGARLTRLRRRLADLIEELPE